MKKRILGMIFAVLTVLVTVCASVYAATIDGITGFATQNGGTTGGAGGPEVSVSTLAEFNTYALDNTARIIKVTGEINSGDDKGASVRLGSNKTILGCGAGAFFNGVGFFISSKSNIIIRNCKFTMISITNTTDPAVYSPTGDEGLPQILTNGGDCIGIQGTSSNIWIDHCEFYGKDPATQPNKDLYDGLTDIKNGSQYITLSWNYYHDHYKCNLVGSSDTDNFDRKITFHHNYYRNINARTPSYRFGTGHVFNSYFADVPTTGVNSRMGACLRVESNYFENTDNPITSVDSSSVGYWDLHNSTNGADNSNIYSGCSGSQPTVSNCAFTPPYVYSSFLDAAADVKTIVMANAGIGKINTGCGVQPTSTRTSIVPTASATRTASAVMSATASVSPTFINTLTRTFTVSPSRTRTVTPTITRTNTAVPPTSSATASMSQTIIITRTPTNSVIPTVTFTRTNTPVPPTMTFTVTPSRTITVTPSFTRTLTLTLTSNPTLTASATMTATADVSAVMTSTVTPAWTTTPSVTGTVILPSATPSSSGTRTNTIVITVTNTAAGTQTNTPLLTATFTRTLSETATSSATASVSPSATASVSPAMTNTNTPANSITKTPSASASRSPTPSNTITLTSSASITPTYTMTFTAVPTLTRTAQASITLTLMPSPTRTIIPSFTNTSTTTQTFAMTATQTPVNTASCTATRTATPVFAAPTPTVTATRIPAGKFEILDLLSYPNPYIKSAGDLHISFEVPIPAKNCVFKIYTGAYRKVAALPVAGYFYGRVVARIPAWKIQRFSAGIYFAILEGESDAGEKAVSKPVEIIILK